MLTAADKCIGCKACVRVCPFAAITWEHETRRILKCDMCEGVIEEGQQPWCVVACPTGALRIVSREEPEGRELKQQYDGLVKDESRIGLAGPDVRFEIDPDLCICCGRCAKECPVECISGKVGKPPAKAEEDARAGKKKGKVGQPFKIDQGKCIRCGSCHEVCPRDAVIRTNEQ